MRNQLHRASREAGAAARIEARHVLPGEPAKRPGDICVPGYAGGKTAYVDVVVSDYAAGYGFTADRRISDPGIVARETERRKRNKRTVAGGPTMHERVRAEGGIFLPMAFTTSGTETGSFGDYIKKLSEIANERFGHNKRYFASKHRAHVACTLHRALADAFLHRARLLAGSAGAYGPQSAEPALAPVLPFPVRPPVPPPGG